MNPWRPFQESGGKKAAILVTSHFGGSLVIWVIWLGLLNSEVSFNVSRFLLRALEK